MGLSYRRRYDSSVTSTVSTGITVRKLQLAEIEELAAAIPEEPIQLSESGDMVIRPDPCIGVVSRDQFESSAAMIKRAKAAIEQASSFGAPTVVFLSTPFIFDEKIETT